MPSDHSPFMIACGDRFVVRCSTQDGYSFKTRASTFHSRLSKKEINSDVGELQPA